MSSVRTAHLYACWPPLRSTTLQHIQLTFDQIPSPLPFRCPLPHQLGRRLPPRRPARGCCAHVRPARRAQAGSFPALAAIARRPQEAWAPGSRARGGPAGSGGQPGARAAGQRRKHGGPADVEGGRLHPPPPPSQGSSWASCACLSATPLSMRSVGLSSWCRCRVAWGKRLTC
jgi:hypothetical protein